MLLFQILTRLIKKDILCFCPLLCYPLFMVSKLDDSWMEKQPCHNIVWNYFRSPCTPTHTNTHTPTGSKVLRIKNLKVHKIGQ